MVHRFLANFLKKKMDREMKQYGVVERAFQKIKASTVIELYIRVLSRIGTGRRKGNRE